LFSRAFPSPPSRTGALSSLNPPSFRKTPHRPFRVCQLISFGLTPYIANQHASPSPPTLAPVSRENVVQGLLSPPSGSFQCQFLLPPPSRTLFRCGFPDAPFFHPSRPLYSESKSSYPPRRTQSTEGLDDVANRRFSPRS